MECLLNCMVKCRTNIAVASQQSGFAAETARREKKRIANGHASSDLNFFLFQRNNLETFCWCDHSLQGPLSSPSTYF